MTRENFNTQWAALMILPGNERATRANQEIFWNLLQDIPDDIWLAGCRKYLQTATFFPGPKDLGVACP